MQSPWQWYRKGNTPLRYLLGFGGPITKRERPKGMDPNATLARIRILSNLLLNGHGFSMSEQVSMAEELAELIQALDDWMTKQGMSPRDWKPF